MTPDRPWGLRLYRAASRVAGPVAALALRRRLREGKEDPSRIGERRGIAGLPRPEGEMVWIHGASVGESLSVLPLVERLKELQPTLNFLVTTGTVTSAKLMASRLPRGAAHQYAPLDHPDFVRAFLDHWRPQISVFVESEFWPNLIIEARKQVEFMALVNGRISPRSYEQWRRRTPTIRHLLSAFDEIVAQDQQNAERLTALSGRPVETFGNLKYAAPPLPGDDKELDALRAKTAGRPLWLAASTHPGEEEAVFAAHATLKAIFPGLLTFLAPRHPERGDEIAALGRSSGLSVGRRSENADIAADTEIYLADTLGELGLFYRLSDVSFVGGGLTPKGGHNPLEPARLGNAILHGPYTFNFADTYAKMRAAGGSALVRNERELATAVRRLLADEKTRRVMSEASRRTAEDSAEKVLAAVSGVLLRHVAPDIRAA